MLTECLSIYTDAGIVKKNQRTAIYGISSRGPHYLAVFDVPVGHIPPRMAVNTNTFVHARYHIHPLLVYEQAPWNVNNAVAEQFGLPPRDHFLGLL